MAFGRMIPHVLLVVVTVSTTTASVAEAQRKPASRRTPAKSAPATTKKPADTSKPADGSKGTDPSSSQSAAGPKTGFVREAPLMQCPSVLGNGIKTQRLFCDILTGSDPASGLRVSIPAHEGPATLLFTLHNRQTYADGPAAGGQVYARYTATLRVVTPNGAVVRETVVQSEFRGPADLVERIAGGAGRVGAKGVAPTGSEPIALELAPGVTEVSLLGQKLTIERLDGTEEVTAPGQPIAIVSQVQIEYRPPAASGTSGTRRRS